jgi:regulator of replication initiation timing
MASVAEQLNKVVEKTERLIELCAALQEENDLLKLESEALNVALKPVQIRQKTWKKSFVY